MSFITEQPCEHDGPGKAAPTGHQEDSIAHLNGQGHDHDHTGYLNGLGHQKFHHDCPPEDLIDELSTGVLPETDMVEEEEEWEAEGFDLFA